METKGNKEDYVHVTFPLIVDEDGYPPVGSERIWAKRLSKNLYEIDNIPFFVTGISCGDKITAKEVDGILYYDEVVEYSGNTTLHVILLEDKNPEAALQRKDELIGFLKSAGCEVEVSHIPTLISVQVPRSASLDAVIAYLKKGAEEKKWDYEESALRQ